MRGVMINDNMVVLIITAVILSVHIEYLCDNASITPEVGEPETIINEIAHIVSNPKLIDMINATIDFTMTVINEINNISKDITFFKDALASIIPNANKIDGIAISDRYLSGIKKALPSSNFTLKNLKIVAIMKLIIIGLVNVLNELLNNVLNKLLCFA